MQPPYEMLARRFDLAARLMDWNHTVPGYPCQIGYTYLKNPYGKRISWEIVQINGARQHIVLWDAPTTREMMAWLDGIIAAFQYTDHEKVNKACEEYNAHS